MRLDVEGIIDFTNMMLQMDNDDSVTLCYEEDDGYAEIWIVGEFGYEIFTTKYPLNIGYRKILHEFIKELENYDVWRWLESRIKDNTWKNYFVYNEFCESHNSSIEQIFYDADALSCLKPTILETIKNLSHADFF